MTLEFDVEREDDYGWLLAYAYLLDGSMFNETLLWEGYAQVGTFPPNTRYWTASRPRKKKLARHVATCGACRRTSFVACMIGGMGSGHGLDNLPSNQDPSLPAPRQEPEVFCGQ